MDVSDEVKKIIETKARIIWKESKDNLEDWKERLGRYEERHRGTISELLRKTAYFFDEKVSIVSIVDLCDYPGKDRAKGEPSTGLVSQKRIEKNDTDVFYWLGRETVLPNSNNRDAEESKRRQTTKIIHEIIHQNFQKELFKDVLRLASMDKEVEEMRRLLRSDQANYLEPEAEMTAIYIDRYANKILQNDSEEKETLDNAVIEYRVEEERFVEIFRAVVIEDLSWKNEGPYTSLRQGWGIPATKDETENTGQKSTGLNLYQIGDKIDDFSLIQHYFEEQRRLDLNYIKEL